MNRTFFVRNWTYINLVQNKVCTIANRVLRQYIVKYWRVFTRNWATTLFNSFVGFVEWEGAPQRMQDMVEVNFFDGFMVWPVWIVSEWWRRVEGSGFMDKREGCVWGRGYNLIQNIFVYNNICSRAKSFHENGLKLLEYPNYGQ